MNSISVGFDGKVYISGMTHGPNSHFPTSMTVCLDDLVEKAVRKVLAEKPQSKTESKSDE